MANSRSRKGAPTRPGSARGRPAPSGRRPASRTAGPPDDLTSSADDAATDADEADVDEVDATSSKPATATTKTATTKTATTKSPTTKATAKTATTKTGDGGATKKPAAVQGTSTDSSTSKRFGDAGGARKGSPPPKTGGRGGRGGRTRPAPPVRVAEPKPWGMIAATLAVLLFAGGAIGYAVYQANSQAIPTNAADIEGVSTFDYGPGQGHVATDVTYTESPGVGGPHDLLWADCDGSVYDVQVRSENAVHSLEHGAVWITYDPDQISDQDLSVLRGYVEGQPYMLMSPYAGLSSPISLQSWNHQLFVDKADDPRISQFIQTLRQNAEEYPEVGASCSQPNFLNDPVIEGEQSRIPGGGAPLTDAPTTPGRPDPATSTP